MAREGATISRRGISPESAFALFLGQLIYDVPDNDQTGIYSALRGHSFSRHDVRGQRPLG